MHEVSRLVQSDRTSSGFFVYKAVSACSWDLYGNDPAIQRRVHVWDHLAMLSQAFGKSNNTDTTSL